MDIETDINEENTWSCSDCFIPVRGKPSAIEIETKSLKKEFQTEYDSAELTEMIASKDHEDILKWIQENQLSLQSHENITEPTKRTLLRQILEEAGNGDEIINKILNSYIQKTTPGLKQSSNSYSVRINFSAITSLDEDGKQEETVLNDLNDLWYDSKKEPWENISDILCKRAKTKKKSSSEILKGTRTC